MSELNINPDVVTENPTVEEPENKPEVKTVTMTQEELDALIGREKGRVKSKYADYNDLKTKLAELEGAENKRKEAEMSELELLQKRLEEKDGTAQSLEKQLEQLHAEVKDAKIKNAFIKAAPGVNIPADRIDAALKLADLSAVNIGENGVEGLEDVMNALVTNYSFLAEVKKPQKPIGEATNSLKDVSEKTSEQLLKEAAEKAKRSQKIEDKIAYAALKAQLSK
jgi:hypothetical protein